MPYRPKNASAEPDSDPPGYVKTLDHLGLEEFNWLYFGLEHRTRWEYRDDDYRRDRLRRDNQFLLRSRGYVGIKDVLDPFRFGVEFQDSRQFNSHFPENDQEVDEADFLQAFGELYFGDALGKGQPLRLQAGRMTLDYLDRRLVGRNRWRNTTNSFDGFRVRLGERNSNWQFDVFAVQPVERRLTRPDKPQEEDWLYGMVGAWRKWDRIITLEPYYFIFDQDRKDSAAADREIHTLGLRGFGPIGDTGLDYDLDAVFQVGEDGDRDHRAFAGYGELGHAFQHKWNPRLSIAGSYATGDRLRDDALGERFDRLFGTALTFSLFNYLSWQNHILARIRLEASPLEKLRMETSYGAYWLASDPDAWTVSGRVDPAGQSGDCIGQDMHIRFRYQIDPRVQLEIGYAHFLPGPFVQNTGPADDGDLFYVQTTFQPYK